jgi:hypothetical protein
LRAAANAPWRMVLGPDVGLANHVAVLANGTSAKG